MIKRLLLPILIALLPCFIFAQSELVVKSTGLKATPFALNEIRLLESPFKNAQDKDIAYLLELEPDRFLNRFYLHAGLPVKGEMYGGWEAMGVTGHAFGHYISACSMAWAATGNDALKKKVDYIITELAKCQEKRGTGYVGGIPDEDKIFEEVSKGDIRSKGFDLNGGWVPWYTFHKMLAGVIDAYRYTGNEQAKTVFIKMSDWVDTKFKNLTEAQFQLMLDCEHGGMMESLAFVYGITGDKKYLDLSNRFYHKKILDPLSQQKDQLGGVHANTQIPKVIGSAQLYELTGESKDETISDYFWKAVTTDHSYVIGGNSNYELFNQAKVFNNQLSSNTTETCNSYNMLKLTRHLFSWNPSAKLMDYYERTLYNHILASIHPETGMTTYYVPLIAGGIKTYATPHDSFWCCTGSGMENHVKYGESIYFKGADNSVYVNLFIPSVLKGNNDHPGIELTTNFPVSGEINMTVTTPESGINTAILLRFPEWSATAAVSVNGEKITVKEKPGSYISINRKWKNGDKIKYTLQPALHTEQLPDNINKTAVLYGPLVLSGELGKQKPSTTELPVLIADRKNPSSWLKKKNNSTLQFETTAAYPNAVTMVPFYQMHDQHYAVYWDNFSKDEWKTKKSGFEAARKKAKELELNTIDIMRIGEMQPERDHNLQGEKTNAGEALSMKYRDARDGGWFSFELNTGGEQAAKLVCTYWGSDHTNRVFDILVDGEKIAQEILENNDPEKYFDRMYIIPAALLKNKTKITVRFQAGPGKTAGGVFGCRLVKTN